MIIVKNRELLIPNKERYIGTNYDTASENRQFSISRFAQNGVDLSALTFRLDLKYENAGVDTLILDKEINDDYIILTWEITNQNLQAPGTVWIQIRAIDSEATVRWSSYIGAMYVDRHLYTPKAYAGSLTEIEQIEQDHQYILGIVNELNASLDYTSDAEAWAVGTRKHVDDYGNVTHPAVTENDETYHNSSKYHADMALYRATNALNSANAAAASATQAAETVADTNARFDNAVAAATVNTEVQDARIGANNTTYTVLKNRLDAEHNTLKDAINAIYNTAYNAERITYSGTTQGYWNISSGKVSITALSSGYFYALPAIPVDSGYLYHVYINAGIDHPDALILATYENGEYTFVSKYTVSSTDYYTYDIMIPAGVTHILITKRGTFAPTVDKYVFDVDDTLTEAGVPADAKAVGDHLAEVDAKIDDVENTIYKSDLRQTSTIDYTTTTNNNYSYYPFNFVKGATYKIHVEFTGTGTPFPNSSNQALTMYTTTAESSSSVYRVDALASQPDFAAVDVMFTASNPAAYLMLYTRSTGSGSDFDGTITISLLTDLREDVDYLYKYNAIPMFTATDVIGTQASYAAVISLYDGLVADYTGYVTKNALNDVSSGAVIYEYVFSTGKYNASVGQRTAYTAYNKPKVLITTGVHGDERGSVASAYTVMQAICADPRLRKLKEQVEFRVVPVVNIYGFDHDSRLDENDVNLNRNFDARWSVNAENAGNSAASEYATQVIQSWLMDNDDALLYIDYHNSGYNAELAYFGVDTEESVEDTNVLCKHFWDGITRIFDYWQNARKLSRTELVFGYVGRVPFTGTTVAYGCEKAGIPSALLETQVRMPEDGTGNKYNKRVIGVAAESLANILLGMHDYLNSNVSVIA